ncbi:MAG: amino acid permease [Pseudomonadota bacterium]
MSQTKEKKLTLTMLTALVAGNMIGSAIFLLPSNLASIGTISLISWLITATGAFLLAIVFSKMSGMVQATGGPYAYARAGFGPYIGFQTACNYWVAVWVGNASIVIAAVGYLAFFFPILQHPVIGCVVAIALIWLFTAINIAGVRSAGYVSLITTALKLIPIIIVIILGWRFFDPHSFAIGFNVSGDSNFIAVSHAATLTLWAFIGLESATVPSGSVENPQRNIPLATLLGTFIAAVVYILSSTLIMGMIPMNVLATSTSPFAAAAKIIFGSEWGGEFIAIGALISCLGSLNGWILLQGQIPMAAAKDGVFPKIFEKCNKHGVPVWGLVITSILISLLLILTISPNLVKQYQITILIASLTSLIPYLYTAIAEILVLKQRDTVWNKKTFASVIVALLAAAYSFWAILGAGEEINFYGAILVFATIPLYGWIYSRNKKSTAENFA